MNEKLIQLVNQLTLADIEFLLNVWKSRLSVYHRQTNTCYDVDDIYRNGCCVEMAIEEVKD